MEETDVWIRWSSAFSTYGRDPGVAGQGRSALAAPIGTLPGRGKRPRDRHTRRRRYRGHHRSRDERGDSPAPEQKRLERPRGSMGALTRTLETAHEPNGATSRVDMTADWAVASCALASVWSIGRSHARRRLARSTAHVHRRGR